MKTVTKIFNVFKIMDDVYTLLWFILLNVLVVTCSLEIFSSNKGRPIFQYRTFSGEYIPTLKISL